MSEYSATELTRTWHMGPSKRTRSMRNCKPFRSKSLKTEAKKKARRSKYGNYTSNVPVLFH